MDDCERIKRLEDKIETLELLQKNNTLTNDIKIALYNNMEKNKVFQEDLHKKLDENLQKKSVFMAIINNGYIFTITMTIIIGLNIMLPCLEQEVIQ